MHICCPLPFVVCTLLELVALLEIKVMKSPVPAEHERYPAGLENWRRSRSNRRVEASLSLSFWLARSEFEPELQFSSCLATIKNELDMSRPALCFPRTHTHTHVQTYCHTHTLFAAFSFPCRCITPYKWSLPIAKTEMVSCKKMCIFSLFSILFSFFPTFVWLIAKTFSSF